MKEFLNRDLDFKHQLIKLLVENPAEFKKLVETLEPPYKLDLSTTVLTIYKLVSNQAIAHLTEFFKQNSVIVSLDLSYNMIPGAQIRPFIEMLRENTTLKTLIFKRNLVEIEGAKIFNTILTTNTTLTSLDFSHSSIQNEGAKVLAEALQVNTTLTSLNIGFNKLDYEALAAFPAFLQKNTTLKSLNLSGCNKALGREEGEVFAKILEASVSLTKLNLSYNNIDEKNIKLLIKVVQRNTKLVALNLRNNFIKGTAIFRIAQMLKLNTSLKKINLGHNQLGTPVSSALKTNGGLVSCEDVAAALKEDTSFKPFRELAAALKENTSLTFLNLEANQICHPGGAIVAEALKGNSALRSLNLHNNFIQDEGIKVVAEFLEVNTALTSLNLRCNGIRMPGIERLGNSLAVNTTLISLDIVYSNMENQQQFLKKINNNFTLLQLRSGNEYELPNLKINLIEDYTKRNISNIKKLIKWVQSASASDYNTILDRTQLRYLAFYQRVQHLFYHNFLHEDSKLCRMLDISNVITKAQCNIINYLIAENYFEIKGVCHAHTSNNPFSIFPCEIIQRILSNLKPSSLTATGWRYKKSLSRRNINSEGRLGYYL